MISDPVPSEKGILKGLIFKLVKKHLAGATADSAIRAALKLNESKLHTTITFLNEHPKNTMQARYNINAYLQLMRQVSRLHANSDISIRPSQLGYGLQEFSLDSIGELLKVAEQEKIMMWLECSNSGELKNALYAAESCKSKFKFLGVELPISEIANGKVYDKFRKLGMQIKLSTYPFENGSRENVQSVQASKGKQKDRKLKDEFAQLGELLKTAPSNELHISSSDDKVVYKIRKGSKLNKTHLVLEVLFGYSQKRIRKLVKDNINVSIYIPYGRDWVPYAISRLTEGHIRDIAVAILDGEKKVGKVRGKNG